MVTTGSCFAVSAIDSPPYFSLSSHFFAGGFEPSVSPAKSGFCGVEVFVFVIQLTDSLFRIILGLTRPSRIDLGRELGRKRQHGHDIIQHFSITTADRQKMLGRSLLVAHFAGLQQS